ncbi:MAG TPA: tetratricopeptide repeat protein [Terriglobales bacterium]|jgi:tetratricopeptide (TPR) repeat protein|nr:tetratricopeptide repeat protein [Terriglobales bacterium]
MQTVLFVGIIVSLLIYYAIWYWGHRGHRMIARGTKTINALDAVTASYRAGDYQTALQQAEGLKRGFSKTPEYCFFRGSMLHQLGKFSEAEASLREGLTLESDSRSKALVSNTLGAVLMDMERYPEAIACFEDSIGAWPDRGTGHREVAEVWLRQGRELPESLARARRAVEIDRASPALSAETHDLRVGEDLALLAWAEAANSSDAQVDSLLAEAFPLCAHAAKMVQAQQHYYAGRAYSALQLLEKAAEHFLQARTVDPQGQFGRLAAAMQAPNSTAQGRTPKTQEPKPGIERLR